MRVFIVLVAVGVALYLAWAVIESVAEVAVDYVFRLLADVARVFGLSAPGEPLSKAEFLVVAAIVIVVINVASIYRNRNKD